MAVENEMVRFVAEIELDPKDQEKFAKALRGAEEQCESLRKSIASTETQMAKMRVEGKENTDEFRRLQQEQKDYNKALKQAIKESNSYSSALDLNKMSVNQLKKHAQQLRSALNSMHKDANPALWDKYNKELIRTEDRLKDLRIGVNGIKEPMLSFRKITDNLKTVPGILGSVAAGATVLVSGLKKMTEQTQVWGDSWAMTQAKVSAGWKQFLANFGQGRNVIKASIKDAVEAAAEAQGMLDELFERNNSLSIQEIKIQTDINKQQAIANDRSKSTDERMAALEEILRLEMKLADMKRSIAQQEKDAALTVLSTRTGLEAKQLEAVIDEYELNRKQIQSAQEYNALLKQQSQLENDLLLTRDAWGREYYGKQLDETKEKLAEFTDSVVIEFAGFLRQYDLGNDDIVNSYVEATKKVLAADRDYEAAVAAQARKRGTLVNQIQSEADEDRKKALEKELQEAESVYTEDLNNLKQQLLDKTISQAEYQTQSSALELAFLTKKSAILKAHGKNILGIDGQIYDKRLALQKSFDMDFQKSDDSFLKYLEKSVADNSKAVTKMMADLQAEVDKMSEDLTQEQMDEFDRLFDSARSGNITRDARRAESDLSFNEDMTELENLHRLKLISEEEFLARKAELTRRHAQEIGKIETEGWENALGTANQILDGIGSAISSAREAEYASLDAWKQKELAAAGDNAEKREQIEAEYEAKKLDIQKKYADIDMGIQIAKAVAAGALASIQAWNAAGGNPIMAAVITALIAATTAAQVATIVAQRNAIKNSSAGGSSIAAGSGAAQVTGFSEGGYTGDGRRLEVAGVVHRGEYVVPQPELRDPYVRSMVASIEAKRRSRVSGHTLPGYADGGYAGGYPVRSGAADDVFSKILSAILNLNNRPVKTYVTLTDLDAKQRFRQNFKKTTSLK